MCKDSNKKVTYDTQDELIYTPETMIHDEERGVYSLNKEDKKSDR